MLVMDFTFRFMKIGKTRWTVAVAYGKRGGEANLSVLKSLVMLMRKPYIYIYIYSICVITFDHIFFFFFKSAL